MLADSFSHSRQKLETALTDLFALAAECGPAASAPKGPALKSLLEPLREPCLVTVAGGPGSGKSTLLNALFGAPVFELSPPAPAALHRHGKTGKRAAEKSGITEVTHAGVFPRDFLLAEWNPGAAAKPVAKEWLPKSEALLFCLPVTRPWERAAWDWLDALPAEARGKLALVLTMSDARTAAEVEAMAEHARGLCQVKHGAAPPMFVVSASLGLRAGLAADSGMKELEAGILQMLRAAPKRATARVAARAAGVELAERIKTRLKEDEAALAAADETEVKRRAAAREALDFELLAAGELGREASEKWSEFSAAAVAEVTLPGFPAMLWKSGSRVTSPESRAADRLVGWLEERGAAPGCGAAARLAIAAGGGDAFLQNRAALGRRTAWFFAALILLSLLGSAAALAVGAPAGRAVIPGALVALFSLALAWLNPRTELAEWKAALTQRAAAAALGVASAVSQAATAHARALARERDEKASSPDNSAPEALRRRLAALEAATRVLQESA